MGHGHAQFFGRKTWAMIPHGFIHMASFGSFLRSDGHSQGNGFSLKGM